MRGLTLRLRLGGFYVSGRFWEAQSVVFYEVWRLQEVQALIALCERVDPLKQPWSSRLADSGVQGLDTREARFIVIYEVWRLQEVQGLTKLKYRVGPPKQTNIGPSEAGSDECLEDCGSGRLHMSYFTRFGGSGRSRL